MFDSRSDIYYASRTELVDYLENWGFAVSSRETPTPSETQQLTVLMPKPMGSYKK